MKLKVGDKVLITMGKDKGRSGKVERIVVGKEAIVVKGINQYKRSVKRRGEQAGGTITLERPINVAKVALICPACNKPTRIGYVIADKGQKQRICKKCKGVLA